MWSFDGACPVSCVFSFLLASCPLPRAFLPSLVPPSPPLQAAWVGLRVSALPLLADICSTPSIAVFSRVAPPGRSPPQ
eukprot:6043749-Alexandrium_andersonii.AAC.1